MVSSLGFSRSSVSPVSFPSAVTPKPLSASSTSTTNVAVATQSLIKKGTWVGSSSSSSSSSAQASESSPKAPAKTAHVFGNSSAKGIGLTDLMMMFETQIAKNSLLSENLSTQLSVEQFYGRVIPNLPKMLSERSSLRNQQNLEKAAREVQKRAMLDHLQSLERERRLPEERNEAYGSLEGLARHYIRTHANELKLIQQAMQAKKSYLSALEIYQTVCAEDFEAARRTESQMPGLIESPYLKYILPYSVVEQCTKITVLSKLVDPVTVLDEVNMSAQQLEEYGHRKKMLRSLRKVAGRNANRFLDCSNMVATKVIPHVLLDQVKTGLIYETLLNTIVSFLYVSSDHDQTQHPMQIQSLSDVIEERRRVDYNLFATKFLASINNGIKCLMPEDSIRTTLRVEGLLRNYWMGRYPDCYVQSSKKVLGVNAKKEAEKNKGKRKITILVEVNGRKIKISNRLPLEYSRGDAKDQKIELSNEIFQRVSLELRREVINEVDVVTEFVDEKSR